MTSSLLWFVPLVALIALTSIALAYVIAGLTPNPQTATNLGSTVTFLIFGFAGVFFPTQALPGVLPDVVLYAVPHTALIEAIRGIVLNSHGISAYGSQIIIGIGWLVAAFAAATVSYRFIEDR